MKKKSYRSKVGKVVRKEKGKSEVKMGDAMSLLNFFFDECIKDPELLVEGLRKAWMRKAGIIG